MSVGDIGTSEIIPLKLIVGDSDMASEKVAVMVTTSEREMILSSSSESERLTVGATASAKKVVDEAVL